jgi:hypothetical protein
MIARRTAVWQSRVRIPHPAPPVIGKFLQKAQSRKNHHREENLRRMNLVKYCDNRKYFERKGPQV